jgi:hypothetical protein
VRRNVSINELLVTRIHQLPHNILKCRGRVFIKYVYYHSSGMIIMMIFLFHVFW